MSELTSIQLHKATKDKLTKLLLEKESYEELLIRLLTILHLKEEKEEHDGN